MLSDNYGYTLTFGSLAGTARIAGCSARGKGLSNAQNITQLLQAASAGDRQASDALFESVYRELRVIAKAQRRGWAGNETLNTTALINEAYVRLASAKLSSYRDRSHFFATASKAMRQVLINYAERLATAKRGSNAIRVTMPELSGNNDTTFDDLIIINNLLEKLEVKNERHCRLFECRVFGGMTIEETAAALDVSPATVKRDWTLLSAWVYREMQQERPS
jgi:RNA polymerase sigma factor (TIGR02999 family)